MKVNYKIAGGDIKVEGVEVLLGEASVEIEISAGEMVTQVKNFKEIMLFIKEEIPQWLELLKHPAIAKIAKACKAARYDEGESYEMAKEKVESV